MGRVVDQPTSVALVGPQLNGPTALPISTAVVWFAATHRSITHICRAACAPGSGCDAAVGGELACVVGLVTVTSAAGTVVPPDNPVGSP